MVNATNMFLKEVNKSGSEREDFLTKLTQLMPHSRLVEKLEVTSRSV